MSEHRYPRRWKCPDWPHHAIEQESALSSLQVIDTSSCMFVGITATLCEKCQEVFDHHEKPHPFDSYGRLIGFQPRRKA